MIRLSAPSPPPPGRVFGDNSASAPPSVPKLPDIDYAKLLPTIPPELQIANPNVPAHVPPELAQGLFFISEICLTLRLAPWPLRQILVSSFNF